MQVKFDKEMLLKHRFWILVGVTTVLTMLGIVYLELYGSEDAEKQKKKWQGELARVKGENAAKGPKNFDEMEKNAKKAKKLEATVWLDAYAQQEKYFRWADEVESEFQFLNGTFAREIKVSKKLDNKKDWPADTATVEFGELDKSTENYIVIINRKGEKVRIQAMAKSVVTVEGEAKPCPWNEISGTKHGKNPMLAITYQKGMYFNDPLTMAEKRVFKKTYAEQIHQILQSVDPLDDKGNGVVQLKSWPYDKEEEKFDEQDWAARRFIRVVNKPWELNKEEISPEAWIAQENLWIQKEIYRIIRAANDDIATFKWDSGDSKKKPQDLKGTVAEKRDTVYRFKNPAFAVELTLQKDDKLVFTIKNLLPRKQKLDLNFRVLLNIDKGRGPETIRISEAPLMPANDPEKKDTITKVISVDMNAKNAAPRKGIYGVEQLLTWETAAVKRIDHVSIGSNASDDIGHSHRTFADDLRPFAIVDEQTAVAVVPVVGRGKGKDPRGKGPKIGPGPVVPAGPGGTNKTMLAHGLWTDRYVPEITEQFRRVPVAVALIVDQDHVDRVLTAFNNSELRFLETQVLLNHYPGSLQPPVLVVEKKDTGVVGPGGRIRPGVVAPGQAPPPASTADSESNMELVVYGIMTLYQRYPPRPALAPDKKQ